MLCYASPHCKGCPMCYLSLTKSVVDKAEFWQGQATTSIKSDGELLPSKDRCLQDAESVLVGKETLRRGLQWSFLTGRRNWSSAATAGTLHC